MVNVMEENRIKLLLNNLEILPGNNTQFRILLTCLRNLQKILNQKSIRDLLEMDIKILHTLRKISNKDIDFIELSISSTYLSLEECQVIVQKNIPKMRRKNLAAYYTNDEGLKLMQALVIDYDRRFKKKTYTICDPFLGSARTLTAVIDKMGAEKFDFIWGIEPYFLSALVAFTSLLESVKGDLSKLSVIHGDAFQHIPEFLHWKNERYIEVDFILTNPPFTRWENISKELQNKLPNLIYELGYKDYLIRIDTGLQTYSMFLCDKLLKQNGLLVSVLPSSTFYTIGGRGYKKLLKEKNKVLALIESINQPAFSIDSGFKEVILISQKCLQEGMTLFSQLKNNIEDLSYSIIYQKTYTNGRYYDIKEIPTFIDNNWLSLLPNDNEIQDIIIEILTKGLESKLFDFWDEIIGKDNIVRGVEMYGPDFFFIPNKYWKIEEIKKSSITIKNILDMKELNLENEYLLKAFRKPGFYLNSIEPDVKSYALIVPETEIADLPSDIAEYILWGIETKTPKPALRKFGKYWYSHIYKTMLAKQPFGNVFMCDKIDLKFKKRGVFANYSKTKISASKNFYVVKDIGDLNSELLCAWLNSSFFLLIFIFFGRKISETWTRLLIDDYLQLPILNIKKIEKQDIENIRKAFHIIRKSKQPPMLKQLNKKQRKDLDLAFAEAMKINKAEEFVVKLHHSLERYFQSLK